MHSTTGVGVFIPAGPCDIVAIRLIIIVTKVCGTLNRSSQVVVHIVFHISDAYYAPGGVRHKACRMVRPTLTIHQVLQWHEVLSPFHSHRRDQQPVVIGAGMEVAQPPRPLVGHNGAYGSIQLITMGLPEMHCLQMPQAGSHSIRRWNTEIISADPGQCLLSLVVPDGRVSMMKQRPLGIPQ